MKSIALIDPYTRGHHIAFMRLFAKSLLKMGNKVWVLTPNSSQEVGQWFKANLPEECAHLHCSEYQEPTFPYTRWGRFNDAVSAFSKWKYLKRHLRGIEKSNGVRFDLIFFCLAGLLFGQLPFATFAGPEVQLQVVGIVFSPLAHAK